MTEHLFLPWCLLSFPWESIYKFNNDKFQNFTPLEYSQHSTCDTSLWWFLKRVISFFIVILKHRTLALSDEEHNSFMYKWEVERTKKSKFWRPIHVHARQGWRQKGWLICSMEWEMARDPLENWMHGETFFLKESQIRLFEEDEKSIHKI